MTRLPSFFIAGVPKAGTSSVATWLADHPQVVPPREKETCFFADETSHIWRADFNAGHGLDAYLAAFDQSSDAKLTFDATPSYIYQATALRMIPSLPTAPKCLFILRDPAEQIRSVYQYYRDNWDHIPATLDFGGFLETVRSGKARFCGNELAENALANADYAPHLAKWAQALGPDRIRVETFDRLAADPRGFMKELADWLDLDPGFYDAYDFPRENESYAPRSRLLQAVNVRLRGLLPKGRAYLAMRALYRRLNTTRPARVDADHIAALRAEFSERTERLAATYGLDLSGWLGDGRSKTP